MEWVECHRGSAEAWSGFDCHSQGRRTWTKPYILTLFRAGHGQRRAALGGAARGAAGAVALPARQAARHRRRRPRRPGGAAAGRLAARALPAEPYPRPPQTLSTNAGTLPHTVQVWPGNPWACSRIDRGTATSQTQLGSHSGGAACAHCRQHSLCPSCPDAGARAPARQRGSVRGQAPLHGLRRAGRAPRHARPEAAGACLGCAPQRAARVPSSGARGAQLRGDGAGGETESAEA